MQASTLIKFILWLCTPYDSSQSPAAPSLSVSFTYGEMYRLLCACKVLFWVFTAIVLGVTLSQLC